MPKVLLPVPHFRQRKEADCLAACAMMCLEYNNIHLKYDRLLTLLKVTPYGTAGQNLTYLASSTLRVTYREGYLDELKSCLHRNLPCIALVRTNDLPYWDYSTDHAVVVVGFDDDLIYVHDPAFATYPSGVPTLKFESAWLSFDYRYGYLEANP